MRSNYTLAIDVRSFGKKQWGIMGKFKVQVSPSKWPTEVLYKVKKLYRLPVFIDVKTYIHNFGYMPSLPSGMVLGVDILQRNLCKLDLDRHRVHQK